MQPSTETTPTPPAHSRALQSSPTTPPSRGVSDRFSNALTQALAPSGPAATAEPAQIVPETPNQVLAPLEACPAAPPTLATAKAMTAAIPDKLIEGGPASPATKPKQDEPSVEVSKTLDVAQSPLLVQPILPAQPVPSTPLQALPAPAQNAATQSGVTEAPTPADPKAALPTAAISVGGQPPSAPGLPAAQPAAQPVPPTSALPPHAAAPSGADATGVQTVPKRLSAVTTKDKPAADLLAIGADAGPTPSAALIAPLMAAPPAIAVPHHAGALPAAVSHSSVPSGLPASAASQVGPALASFVASAAHPGAPQSLVIRLDPMELGRVQVRIERSPDGSARVDLVVERPDTLLLLLRDQPQLHRTLDLAGVPSTDRTLQFHLTPPGATPSGSMSPQSNADHGPGQHRPGQPQPNRATSSGTIFSLGDPIAQPAASRRAGVDITA